MTLAIALAALAFTVTLVVMGLWVLSSARALSTDRAYARAERHAHRDVVANIIADFSAERSEWAQERAVLLNRIQDPAATAFTSNVAMMPPAADMSMEIVT